jgi:multidrug efflux pump
VRCKAILTTRDHPSSAARGLAFAPNRPVLATGGWNRAVQFWQDRTLNSLRQRPGPSRIELPEAVTTLAFTPDGATLASMERLSRDLPRNMTTEWTEVSFLQKRAGKIEQFRDLRNNPFSAFAVGVVLVFFVLAGLYESWSTPWAVILVVPMCLLSALIGLAMRGMDVNIFVQVGFVVLVGLAAKNAILIVEFARDRQHQGASRFDAAVEAARERLRPILMTSLAFILGVFPLVIAEGAGAEMRQTLGTAVFYGMIGVTVFGLFLTPMFYFVVRWLVERKAPAAEKAVVPVQDGTGNAATAAPPATEGAIQAQSPQRPE